MKRINQLQIFRFIGAMVVALYHMKLFLAPYTYKYFNMQIFLVGDIWVRFFFALSGFVLAYSYYKKSITSYIDFYTPKLIRIYTMIMALMLYCIVLTNFDLGKFISSILGLFTFVPRYINGGTYNGNTWYLFVYMIFLILFPFLKKIADKKRSAIYIITGLVVLFNIYIALRPEIMTNLYGNFYNETNANYLVYFSPLLYFGTFLMGMCAAYILVDYNIKIKYGFITILFLILFLYFNMSYVFKYIDISILFVLLILIVSADTSKVSRFLSNRVFVYLGNISLAIYLIHDTTIVFLRKYFHIENAFIIFFVIILFSCIFYELIEKRVSGKLISLFKNFRNRKQEN